MKPITEADRRRATLELAIRLNKAFLASVPAGSDLAGEKQLEADERELECLLAQEAA
jgi:hypothetical protein